ncbi:hypothetical protein B0H16DRAFT_552936 [Mycena metata]|uniref:Uncharacterized protein n=1 Tax=Mycena metata TaxID=1033252 RepID=A0AAD7MDX7_9AGAR|nr:hypothetical protein B0H16DRAFT_552936 [Mycena metata]
MVGHRWQGVLNLRIRNAALAEHGHDRFPPYRIWIAHHVFDSLPPRRHQQLTSRALQSSPPYSPSRSSSRSFETISVVVPILSRRPPSATSSFLHPRCFCTSLNLLTLSSHISATAPLPFSVRRSRCRGPMPVPSPSRPKSLARPPRRHFGRRSLAVSHKRLLGIPPRPPAPTFCLGSAMRAHCIHLADSIPHSSSRTPSIDLTPLLSPRMV